jgi:hypothetical protein
MKLVALASVLSLALACSSRSGPESSGGTPVPGSSLEVSGPYTLGHLSLFLVEDPKAAAGEEMITLSEGLGSGAVRVTEKASAQVRELLIENQSDKACFVQAGDVVKGGQQDRAIGRDFVLPPHTAPTPVSSFCVEHNRWTGGKAFKACPQNAYGNGIKLAIQQKGNQQEVWDTVAKQKADVRANANLGGNATSSLNEELEDPTIKEKLHAIQKEMGSLLAQRPHAIGLVTALNGKLVASDVYGDPGLFRKLYPRLLDSAAMTALATKASPAPAPTMDAAARFLSAADQGTSKEEEVRKDLKMRTCENEKGVEFDYSWQGRRIHCQALQY